MPSAERSGPGISLRAIRPVVIGLEALGHEVDALLGVLGLGREALDEPDALDRYLPHEAVMRFWRTAAERAADPCIGLHAAEAVNLETFDMHAFAVLSSSSYLAGLERASRYQRLLHESTTLEVIERDETVTVRHALPGGVPVPRYPAQYLVTLWVRFGRAMLGSRWTAPLAVRLAHDGTDSVEEYRRVLGRAPAFDASENSLTVAAASARAPSTGANPALARILDRYAEQLVATRAPATGASFASRVEAALGDLVDGVPTAAELAASCHVSVRTLHRRLRAEGTSFRELLRGVRRRRAAELLCRSDRSLAEIAFLLGYSELSAFHAAFRRWYGTTSGDYRRTHR